MDSQIVIVTASLGVGDAATLSGALFYLIGSTLACAALFLLAEILQRAERPRLDDFDHGSTRACACASASAGTGRKRTRSPGCSSVGGSDSGVNSATAVRPMRFQPPGVSRV